MNVLGLLLAILTGAVVETRLLEHWHHIGLRQRAPYVEQSVNYLVYLGPPILIIWALMRRRWTRQSLHAFEGVVAVGFVSALVVGTAWLLPWKRSVSPPVVFLMVGVLAALAAVGFRLRAIRVGWRVALVAALIGIVGLEPAFGPFTGHAHPKTRTAGPDVVLVVFDTLREDALSCYGAAEPTSPVVDGIAARGIRFTNAYAQSSWTLPTTATIHTGRYPSSHGATAKGRGIAPELDTLAERFRAKGYETAAFSENHLVTPRYGFGQGFDRFWAPWIPRVNSVSAIYEVFERTGLRPVIDTRRRSHAPPAADPSDVTWDARVTVDHALEFLDGTKGPTFLYLHFMGPHGPYGPPEFLLANPPERRVIDHPRDMGGAYPIGPKGGAVSDTDLDTMRRLYAADVAYVDRELGRVLSWFEGRGRLADAVLLVTADHGEEFYEHAGWNHGGSVFDEVVHVPLVLATPLHSAKGLVVSSLVSQVDIAPTLAELAGLPAAPSGDGVSLASVRDGERPVDRDVLIEGYPNRPPGARIEAVVSGTSKLVHIEFGARDTLLLFDVADDPGERRDLAGARPALRDSLRGRLLDMRTRARERAARARDIPVDSESLDALRNLGYVR